MRIAVASVRGSSFGRSPGIDDVDAGVVEIRQVAGCQCGTTRPADGCDECVEPGDWPPGSLASARDDRVVLSGGHIDRQDLIGKGPEDVVSGVQKNLLPPTV